MKIGLSSYSFRPMLADGTLSVDGMFDWLSANGAEHVEIATFCFCKRGTEADYDLTRDENTLVQIEAASARTGIPVSGLCTSANFLVEGDAARRAQIDNVKRHIDLCARLGAKFLRHDVVLWGHRPENDTAEFDRVLPVIADACRELAEYGQSHGVLTSVENHGMFVTSSERVLRLKAAVNHPNFKLTVDVGNFLCVDDNPLIATRRTVPEAGFVHLKDFYVRQQEPGAGWLKTLGGQFIRGSVYGFGDLDTRAILQAIIASGYDGFVSLEFEGGEPSFYGCETGLANIRRMLGEIGG